MIFSLLMIGTATAAPLRALERAVTNDNRDALINSLAHKKSYVREMAARNLRVMPRNEVAVAALSACLDDTQEKDFVRATCAGTLASWSVNEASAPIIAAMSEVTGEPRYWMAHALYILNTRAARSH